MRVKEVVFSSSSTRSPTAEIKCQTIQQIWAKPTETVKTRRTVAEILRKFQIQSNSITKQARTDMRKQYFWFFFLSSLFFCSVFSFLCVCVCAFFPVFLFLSLFSVCISLWVSVLFLLCSVYLCVSSPEINPNTPSYTTYFPLLSYCPDPLLLSKADFSTQICH